MKQNESRPAPKKGRPYPVRRPFVCFARRMVWLLALICDGCAARNPESR